MIYARRRIKLTFTSSQAGRASATFENLRTTVRVLNAGGLSMSSAQVMIYGLTLEHIDDLSTYGQAIFKNPTDHLSIEAGDDVNGMSQIFEGEIQQAWGDFQGAPDVPFHVVAYGGIYPQVQEGKPTSTTGQADVATLMKGFADQMGYKFENHGVTTKLPSWYSYGSPRQQALTLADAAGIEMVLEKGKMAIWPRFESRGDSGLVITPKTGMASYPTFTDYGVLIKVEYTRPIDYGTDVTIQGSDLKKANGTWNVILVDYDLQALTPRGHWFTNLGCRARDYKGVVLPTSP